MRLTLPISSTATWTGAVSSSRLGIGFGDQVLDVPANSQYFATTVTMTYSGTTFQVQIEGGIHLATGQVYASFRSIDPATGLPPPVNVGFLPPEYGSGQGMGYLTYIVNPKAYLPTGPRSATWLTSRSMATTRSPPTRSIRTTPRKAPIRLRSASPRSTQVRRPAASIPCRPSKPRRASPSPGLAATRPVARESPHTTCMFPTTAAFTLWQTGTADTSATYAGQLNHTYAFYSVATDNVGHREAKTAMPRQPPPFRSRQARPRPSRVTIQPVPSTVRWSHSRPPYQPSALALPAGSVQFDLDGGYSGWPVTLVNGSATSPGISSLGVGSHTIAATYRVSRLPGEHGLESHATCRSGALTVPADNQSRLFGQSNPTFTYAIRGYVNGEDDSVVSGTPDINCPAQSTSPVSGSPYPITVGIGTLSAANYDFPNLSPWRADRQQSGPLDNVAHPALILF